MGMCGYAWVCVGMRGYAWVRVCMHGYAWVCVGMRGYNMFGFSNLRKTGNLLNMLYTMSAEFQQNIRKQKFTSGLFSFKRHSCGYQDNCPLDNAPGIPQRTHTHKHIKRIISAEICYLTTLPPTLLNRRANDRSNCQI